MLITIMIEAIGVMLLIVGCGLINIVVLTIDITNIYN